MDGTDLSEAYNMRPVMSQMPEQEIEPLVKKSESGPKVDYNTIVHEMQQNQQPPPPVHTPNQRSTPIRQIQHQQEVLVAPGPMHKPPSRPAFNHTEYYTQNEQPAPQPTRQQPSYIDTMVTKKRDVFKMVSIAVVILLAISIHAVVDFGLKEFIFSNEFSFKQELGIRLIYPLLAFFLLWNMKAIGSISK